MKKLFMLGLGGEISPANIEVHDVQFVIASRVEDTYDQLKNRWYGERLHLDSYTDIQTIDGYQVDLEGECEKNLYMIVYGGYREDSLDEIHRYDLILASSLKDAKDLGKAKMRNFPNMDHMDKVVDVFLNVGHRFGFMEASVSLTDNKIVHTFIQLIK